MITRQARTIHWLYYEQTKPQAVLLDFKMVSFMTGKIAISYATPKKVLNSVRSDRA